MHTNTMPRPAQFSRQEFVDAAVSVCARGGPGALTMAAVARSAGAPTGSLYHRFASREELLAETWMDSMTAFQSGFLDALRTPSSSAGLEAALFPVRWARGHIDPARLLVLYRRQDFVPGETSKGLHARAAALAVELDHGISDFAAGAFGDIGLAAKQRAVFLLIDLPNAAIRRYLAAGMTPPAAVDRLVEEAVRAMSTASTGPD